MFSSPPYFRSAASLNRFRGCTSDLSPLLNAVFSFPGSYLDERPAMTPSPPPPFSMLNPLPSATWNCFCLMAARSNSKMRFFPTFKPSRRQAVILEPNPGFFSKNSVLLQSLDLLPPWGARQVEKCTEPFLKSYLLLKELIFFPSMPKHFLCPAPHRLTREAPRPSLASNPSLLP